jgi:signal transduction histidine kinase
VRDATLRRIALVSYAVFVIGIIAGQAMGARSHAGDAVFPLVLFAFPTVGIAVLNKRPRTTLGWLMLSMGVITLPVDSYGAYALNVTHGAWPGGVYAIGAWSWTWVPFIGISGFLLLLFPDGHLASRRWRWFAWMCGFGLVALSLTVWFLPGNLADAGFPDIQNPFGIESLRSLGGWAYLPVVFAPLVVVGGAIAVIVRLRRTHDVVERQQLRLLAWTAGIIAALYVVAFIPSIVLGSTTDSTWSGVLGTLAASSFMLIPIAIGVAIMRYRLYEVDVVIRKTVIFALLAAFITLVYVLLVAGIGIFVGSRNENTGVAAAAVAAAVVALAFQPVSRWARRLADRLVYGERANPYEVLARFGDQLGESYAADDVLTRIARVLTEGIGAERARVWLRVDGSLRQVAMWPPDASGDGADDLSVDVRHQGEDLGALSVAVPANDPLDPTKEKLVRDLAAQAGLVLRNVRLTEQLRARLEDLQAAQKRLVAAQDQERRRLERNIHDGAQQQLVALAVQARLARQLLDRDPAQTAAMLERIANDTQTAIDDLRDLAHGIYPPLLADKGLVAALESQGRRSPVSVSVEAADLGRFPAEIEAAVYFATLEALQNVAKYADATTATVRLEASDGWLRFTVNDDGTGFDPDATSYGSGLQGIADRLGALDGTLEVRSALGAGTTIVGALPVSIDEAGGSNGSPPGTIVSDQRVFARGETG